MAVFFSPNLPSWGCHTCLAQIYWQWYCLWPHSSRRSRVGKISYCGSHHKGTSYAYYNKTKKLLPNGSSLSNWNTSLTGPPRPPATCLSIRFGKKEGGITILVAHAFVLLPALVVEWPKPTLDFLQNQDGFLKVNRPANLFQAVRARENLCGTNTKPTNKFRQNVVEKYIYRPKTLLF